MLHSDALTGLMVLLGFVVVLLGSTLFPVPSEQEVVDEWARSHDEEHVD